MAQLGVKTTAPTWGRERWGQPREEGTSMEVSDWDSVGPGSGGGWGWGWNGWSLASYGWGGAESGYGWGWAGPGSQVPTLLTLLSAARITRQHASTGPTPLSDREPVVRPRELSAHKLWLGEMPGSWAGKSTPWQVRAGVGAQRQALGSLYLTQVGTDRARQAPALIFPSKEDPPLPLPTQNHHLNMTF